MVAQTMKSAVALLATAFVASSLSAQEDQGAAWRDYELEARVWLDRGAEPVLQQGERVRVYYRVSEDANVAIFHIDTDGTVRLVFPRSPRENHIVLGNRDYRVLFPETSYWFVDDYPGMGYFFVLASPEPLDLSQFTYSHYDGGWDLSRVGRQVYTDPYEAIDDYVAALIPDWETSTYGLDFTSYHVGDSHDYPRFLCYDCHGFQPYYAWNPYYYACTSFRVVVYNDPYYYPSYRYGGGVVVTPPLRHDPRFVFKERATGEPGTALLTTRAETPLSSTRGQFTRSSDARVTSPSRSTGAVTGKEDATGSDDDLPVIVPWPGRTTRPTPTSLGGQATERGSANGPRAVPTGGPGVRTPVGGPSARPSTSPGRPVLERRRPPSGQPSTPLDAQGRVIPSGGTRPSGDGASAAPRSRPTTGTTRPRGKGASRPSTGARSQSGRNPTSGFVRPPSSRPSGGSARPSSPPRSGASARPSGPRRNGGAARPSSPARNSGSARPSAPSRSGGSARPSRAGPTGGRPSAASAPSRSSSARPAATRRRNEPDS